MRPPQQLAGITEGRQDDGFLLHQKDYPDGVSASVVKHERLLLALPADHHLAGALEIEALAGGAGFGVGGGDGIGALCDGG